MNAETEKKLHLFHMEQEEADIPPGGGYRKFEAFLKETVSGEGMVGENSYLILWKKDQREDLNEAYAVREYLDNVFLIGSDGGDMAYGLNEKGEYIEVPFIGMNDREVKIIAGTFDEFIDYLWNKA